MLLLFFKSFKHVIINLFSSCVCVCVLNVRNMKSAQLLQTIRLSESAASTDTCLRGYSCKVGVVPNTLTVARLQAHMDHDVTKMIIKLYNINTSAFAPEVHWIKFCSGLSVCLSLSLYLSLSVSLSLYCRVSYVSCFSERVRVIKTLLCSP